jgi:hypothetical protein
MLSPAPLGYPTRFEGPVGRCARLVATANAFPMSKGAYARASGGTGNRRRLKIGGQSG